MRTLIIDRILEYANNTQGPEITGMLRLDRLGDAKRVKLAREADKLPLNTTERLVAWNNYLASLTDKELVSAFDGMCCHKYR